MKLKTDVLQKVNKPRVRLELANVLDCTEQTIIRYIKKNEENGPLTSLAAMKTIKKCTGMTTTSLIYA